MYEQIEELKLYFQVIYLGIRETDGILTFTLTLKLQSQYTLMVLKLMLRGCENLSA